MKITFNVSKLVLLDWYGRMVLIDNLYCIPFFGPPSADPDCQESE